MPGFPSNVRRGLRGALAVAALAVAPTAPAVAGQVLVTVEEVGASDGTVSVALCTRDTFLSDLCPYAKVVPAVEGRTELLFDDVPPGVFGVQAFHDANGNGKMDRNIVGFPLEGFAFGNGAAPTVTAPSFDEAAVEIGPYGGLIVVVMLYY